MSNELNIAPSTISGYETERKEPDYDTLNNSDIDNLPPESKEDLKRYLELLKIKDMQKRNSDGDEIKRSE